MANPVIKVEGLSKRFIISHERRESYSSLRDVIARKAEKLFSTSSPEDKSFSQEEFWALRDLNFEIKRGDRIGIIGRNGAGKSTLLKILSRITEPSSGRIEIDGRVASLLEVGTGFHPELTGRENIFLNGAILGMTRYEIRKKFNEIVEFAEIEKFLDTPVKRYSSGMYVRLAFAVAAHLEPEILIVDEVLAVGDIQFQRKCLGKMEDVSRQDGRTVLFVSHDLNSVSKLCSNAILLDKGQVSAIGEIEEVLTKYLSFSKKMESNLRRSGTGEIEVIDILFRNLNGEELESLITDQPAIIEVACHCKQPIQNVEFAVCFNNFHNTRVTSVWSAFNGTTFNLEKSYFKILFELSSVRLIPGDYQLISFVSSGHTTIDRIDNFKFCNVKYPDYDIEKRIPTLAQGYYLENFTVQIEQ